MSTQNKPRPRGNVDTDDENLRGSNRQLRKEVDQWKRYCKHLEKKIRRYEANFNAEDDEENTAVPEVKPSSGNLEGRKCKSDKCRSTNLKSLELNKRNEPTTIWICQDCGSRETVKT